MVGADLCSLEMHMAGTRTYKTKSILICLYGIPPTIKKHFFWIPMLKVLRFCKIMACASSLCIAHHVYFSCFFYRTLDFWVLNCPNTDEAPGLDSILVSHLMSALFIYGYLYSILTRKPIPQTVIVTVRAHFLSFFCKRCDMGCDERSKCAATIHKTRYYVIKYGE